jgi:hypothetical protein
VIIDQTYISIILVSLPIFDFNNLKQDYSLSLYSVIEQEKQENTLEYNYITTEKFLESNNNKYQEIIR